MSRQKLDLWPADFGKVSARLPIVILREQAALLGAKTGNLVQAVVKSGPFIPTVGTPETRTSAPGSKSRTMTLSDLKDKIKGRDPSWIAHRFQLVAPALDNYKYELFTVEHRLDAPYPLRLVYDGKPGNVQSEKQLVDHLARVFNSEDTKRVIANLIQQSQAA